MTTSFTIENIESVLYKDKASKFIGFAYHVKDENDIKERLDYVKSLHPKATHHCYAYRIGSDKNNFRANDDGEPNGSSGKPILGQIDSFGVTNCLVIIVRYFGGTKLGVPGLISAYNETAKETMASTQIIEHKILAHYKITCDYTDVNRIYQLIHNLKAILAEQHLDNWSTFIIAVEQNKATNLESILTEEQIEFVFSGRK